ncbi:2,4-dienoyl-CoA reductase [(2E)-enoyl-CoA-producing] [Malassezia sp. CBS 17886]|nr:2,4-dienoyl-CoA reductase [(2E)-enoyl-CoA-producing] [Malassezia sp. CBS 17886]
MAESFKHSAVPATNVFKPDLFRGKVVFVTGGGSGICYAITETLMRFGASAAIVGRKADRLQKAAAQLERDTGSRALATPGDVRKYEQMEDAVKKTVETFGKIDFVICGAAGNFMAPMEGLSANAFRTVVEIDLLGTFNTARATMEEVKKNHGNYIHISATLHYSGLPWQIAPSAAKAGVDALSAGIAVELAPFGGSDRLVPQGGEDVVEGFIPLQRVGQKDDIANASVFLFSDAASWITGQVLAVDGGHMHFRAPWLPYPDSSLNPREFKSLFPGSKL